MRPRSRTPTYEWQEAFRRARDALIAWLLIGGAGAFVTTQVSIDSAAAPKALMVTGFAAMAGLYGSWRVTRLLLIRWEVSTLGRRRLGRMFVAVVSNPIPRSLHEVVLVWKSEPRLEGARLEPPDLCYLADLSERDQAHLGSVLVRESWTIVDERGTPASGRWFQTAGDLVMTSRRAGPLVRLAIRRGVAGMSAVVMTPQPPSLDLRDVWPIGLRGLPWAVAWRTVAIMMLGALAVLTD